MSLFRSALPTAAALAALTAVAAAPAPAAAQVATDAGGFPLRTMSVTLVRGHTYELRTDYELTSVGAGLPDSVLSLRSSSGATATTLAGADGCATAPGGSTLRPSCFSYTVPAGAGSVMHWLLLRAWRGSTPGQTHLWMRDVTADTPWQQLTTTPISFGGGVMSRSWSGSARLFVNTTHRPGNNDAHGLWIAASEWNVKRVHSLNGRISGTAKLDVPDRAAAGLAGAHQVIFGALFANAAGPMRVVENDWHIAGSDVDGDGLGVLLERALGVCDRASDVVGAGFRCDRLPGCSTPDSSLCKASLRDTDHDGLRDDLELFGGTASNLSLARWGANPAQMDVFVELDAYDQRSDIPGCQGFTAATVQRIGADTPTGADEPRELRFFEDFQRVYAQAPARLNPNGQPGIRFHWDVGVANPDPLDDAWGAWGGGNTCLPDTCPYTGPFDGGHPGCPAGAMDPARRWVFRYGTDGVGPGGQTSGARAYVAGHTSHHVHEMGHMGGLQHGGPWGASGANDHFSNHRLQYASRMSYVYQDVGNTDASDLARWDQMSFSSGTLGGLGFRTTEMSEVCPAPGKDLRFMKLVGTDVIVRDATCQDVDWNRNGVIDPEPTYDQQFTGYHAARWSLLHRDHRSIPSAISATTVGNVLLLAYAAPYSDFGNLLTFRADGNADCNQRPFAPTVPNDDGFATGGVHPGCFRPGAEIRPYEPAEAVAVSSARVPGGTEGAVVVYTQPDGQLRWATMTVAPATNAQEVTHTFTPRGTVPGVVVSNAVGSREPALVRQPGTSTLLLVYRDPTGVLRQATLPAASTTWSLPTEVRTTAAASVPSATAVSLAVLDSDVVMALAEPTTKRIRTYRRLASGLWQAEAHLLDTTDLRPTLAAVRTLDDPSARQLQVYYAGTDRVTYLVRFVPGSASVRASSDWHMGGQRISGAPTIVYDERPVLGTLFRGLRVYRFLGEGDNACTVDADCAWASAFAARCQPVAKQCVDAANNPLGRLFLEPFAQGPEPGLYTDYDDWKGLQYGLCHQLEVRAGDAPSTTSDLVPVAYNTNQCGPQPTYPEP